MQQPPKHIIVQLIDGTGRALGSMRLPSHLRLDDLKRLAFSAGQSLEQHIEQSFAAQVRQRAQEASL